MHQENSKLVFSTDKHISRKKKTGNTNKVRETAGSTQNVFIRLERKGRGGKSVTVVDGISLNKKDMMTTLKQLKAKLGTGGAVKGTCMEFQGDQCSRVMSELKKLGYKTKRSGG